MQQQIITDDQAKYCLYARKSTEGDERQAMSIDSQIKEMTAIANRDGIQITDIREERFSAKMSGSRPVFNSILTDIRSDHFNAILTWAPDRLSRNAGDLGMLVDLMDQGKLQFIKTFSQTFTNSPNEKFLLMILCSQAKLENDNKGINVKRGIRAKCQMGWRPGMAPLGYYNRAFNGVKDIIIDPERGPKITEAFERVGIHGKSGWDIKRWFDKVGFRNRSGAKVTISQVYLLLKNPFYYGEFEYPLDSGSWYKGSHPPLISKELFEQTQEQLKVPQKSKWGAKQFTFKGLFKCGECRSTIIGEEKFKKLLNGKTNRHVYYHCSKQLNQCRQPYLNEKAMLKQLRDLVANLDESKLKLSYGLKLKIDAYRKIQQEVFIQHNLNPTNQESSLKQYALFTLWEGASQDQRELIQGLNLNIVLKDKQVEIKNS